MASSLLDVNLLFALAWPNHQHHASARSWLTAHGADGWATCSLTQGGFVRLSCNPGIPPGTVTVQEAVEILRRLVSLTGHRFWADDTSFAEPELVALDRLIGHRQITDAHLLSLALRRGGRLVTADRGIRQLVPPGFDARDVVVLLT